MQAVTLDLSKCICGSEGLNIGADIRLSLKPFISFLRDRMSREKTAKINFYKYLLEQFDAFPELNEPIDDADTSKYNHLFELIYTALSPVINDEKEQLWALGKPVSPCFYYGTNAFYNILLDWKTKGLKSDLKLPSEQEMEKSALTNFYSLILKKYYGFTLGGQEYTIKSFIDHDTHLLKYYRMNIDSRFLEVEIDAELPDLKLQDIKEYMKNESGAIEGLQKLLPPELFRIEGIALVTLTDVTAEYALEAIKTTIIAHNQCQVGWSNEQIVRSLQAIVGTDQMSFNLLPYIRLNNKTLLYNHAGFESVIIEQAKANGLQESEYNVLADEFVAHPRRLIFPDISAVDAKEYPMLKLIYENGVKSYALFPLFYNAKLVGCLEIYTRDAEVFSSSTLPKIEGALPLLAQLYQNIIIDFNNEIMTIVTDKFTALQSSVQWRFYEAAYQYMKSGAWEKDLPIDQVYFKDVHPFYGAIDIRNSSIERNLMIRKDLFTHFEVLETTIGNLKTKIPAELEEELPQHSLASGYQNFEEMSDRDIMKTDDYLQRQLPQYLHALGDEHPETKNIIDNYFEVTREGGKIYENRENYELSMQMINHAVNRRLDEFNQELQDIYPSYFEKFRTDGVEFDIYLGQSISPDHPFSFEVLADFRLRQLQVIAEIAQITANLTPHLPINLETTQLIFVYGKQIDISFRLDEQRFDVEGSYNIRYQMVKKRIDKAHVRDTTERLTQPGKIAIVYLNSEEAQEYMVYIRKLQADGLLTEVVENLEVEELQGVEGLKALRVEVAIAMSLN
jgi:hypothetical protein